MHSIVNQALVTHFPVPVLALRREMLVTGLFKYMADIRELEGRVADYIDYEGQHSSRLTFTLVAEPNGGPLWLQVRGSESEKAHIRAVYITHRMRMSPTV